MKRTLLCAVFISILSLQSLHAQVTTITGKLLDADGKPSKNALVGCAVTSNGNGKVFVQCKDNGTYSLQATNRGWSYLIFSIPSHEAVRIPIRNTKNRTLTIDVQLAAYQYKDSLEAPGIYGSFNNYNRRAMERMTKQENGTYTYEVKTDQNEVRYQLLEIEKNGRTVNGTDGTAFFPDSSGDYHSVVTVTNGKAVIVFDPAKLYRRSSERKVAFKNSRQDEKIFEVYAVHEKTERNAGKALSEYAKVNKDLRGFHIDGGTYLQDLPKNIDAEKDRDVKDALKLAYLSFGRFRPLGYDNGKAKTYFESLAPSNPMWDLLPGGFSILQTVVPQFQWDEVQDKFLAECPSMQIRTIIIANKLSSAKFAGNEAELKRWHAIIANEYKDVPDMQRLAKMFPAETKIKAGVEIPDYELASMNPSEESYSKKKMLGKIYLIDFWATWCGPCVGEMERLHAAYEKFKDKGFDIISISMDAKLEDVQRFRTDKWKMPWKHSFIGTNRESKIIGDFEVIGIPKPVLVSAEGKVLALESDVRGESLEKTLEKYFK